MKKVTELPHLQKEDIPYSVVPPKAGVPSPKNDPTTGDMLKCVIGEVQDDQIQEKLRGYLLPWVKTAINSKTKDQFLIHLCQALKSVGEHNAFNFELIPFVFCTLANENDNFANTLTSALSKDIAGTDEDLELGLMGWMIHELSEQAKSNQADIKENARRTLQVIFENLKAKHAYYLQQQPVAQLVLDASLACQSVEVLSYAYALDNLQDANVLCPVLETLSASNLGTVLKYFKQHHSTFLQFQPVIDMVFALAQQPDKQGLIADLLDFKQLQSEAVANLLSQYSANPVVLAHLLTVCPDNLSVEDPHISEFVKALVQAKNPDAVNALVGRVVLVDAYDVATGRAEIAAEFDAWDQAELVQLHQDVVSQVVSLSALADDDQAVEARKQALNQELGKRELTAAQTMFLAAQLNRLSNRADDCLALFTPCVTAGEVAVLRGFATQLDGKDGFKDKLQQSADVLYATVLKIKHQAMQPQMLQLLVNVYKLPVSATTFTLICSQDSPELNQALLAAEGVLDRIATDSKQFMTILTDAISAEKSDLVDRLLAEATKVGNEALLQEIQVAADTVLQAALSIPQKDSREPMVSKLVNQLKLAVSKEVYLQIVNNEETDVPFLEALHDMTNKQRRSDEELLHVATLFEPDVAKRLCQGQDIDLAQAPARDKFIELVKPAKTGELKARARTALKLLPLTNYTKLDSASLAAVAGPCQSVFVELMSIDNDVANEVTKAGIRQSIAGYKAYTSQITYLVLLNRLDLLEYALSEEVVTLNRNTYEWAQGNERFEATDGSAANLSTRIEECVADNAKPNFDRVRAGEFYTLLIEHGICCQEEDVKGFLLRDEIAFATAASGKNTHLNFADLDVAFIAGLGGNAHAFLKGKLDPSKVVAVAALANNPDLIPTLLGDNQKVDLLRVNFDAVNLEIRTQMLVHVDNTNVTLVHALALFDAEVDANHVALCDTIINRLIAGRDLKVVNDEEVALLATLFGKNVQTRGTFKNLIEALDLSGLGVDQVKTIAKAAIIYGPTDSLQLLIQYCSEESIKQSAADMLEHAIVASKERPSDEAKELLTICLKHTDQDLNKHIELAQRAISKHLSVLFNTVVNHVKQQHGGKLPPEFLNAQSWYDGIFDMLKNETDITTYSPLLISLVECNAAFSADTLQQIVNWGMVDVMKAALANRDALGLNDTQLQAAMASCQQQPVHASNVVDEGRRECAALLIGAGVYGNSLADTINFVYRIPATQLMPVLQQVMAAADDTALGEVILKADGEFTFDEASIPAFTKLAKATDFNKDAHVQALVKVFDSANYTLSAANIRAMIDLLTSSTNNHADLVYHFLQKVDPEFAMEQNDVAQWVLAKFTDPEFQSTDVLSQYLNWDKLDAGALPQAFLGADSWYDILLGQCSPSNPDSIDRIVCKLAEAQVPLSETALTDFAKWGLRDSMEAAVRHKQQLGIDNQKLVEVMQVCRAPVQTKGDYGQRHCAGALLAAGVDGDDLAGTIDFVGSIPAWGLIDVAQRVIQAGLDNENTLLENLRLKAQGEYAFDDATMDRFVELCQVVKGDSDDHKAVLKSIFRWADFKLSFENAFRMIEQLSQTFDYPVNLIGKFLGKAKPKFPMDQSDTADLVTMVLAQENLREVASVVIEYCDWAKIKKGKLETLRSVIDAEGYPEALKQHVEFYTDKAEVVPDRVIFYGRVTATPFTPRVVSNDVPAQQLQPNAPQQPQARVRRNDAVIGEVQQQMKACEGDNKLSRPRYSNMWKEADRSPIENVIKLARDYVKALGHPKRHHKDMMEGLYRFCQGGKKKDGEKPSENDVLIRLFNELRLFNEGIKKEPNTFKLNGSCHRRLVFMLKHFMEQAKLDFKPIEEYNFATPTAK